MIIRFRSKFRDKQSNEIMGSGEINSLSDVVWFAGLLVVIGGLGTIVMYRLFAQCTMSKEDIKSRSFTHSSLYNSLIIYSRMFSITIHTITWPLTCSSFGCSRAQLLSVQLLCALLCLTIITFFLIIFLS